MSFADILSSVTVLLDKMVISLAQFITTSLSVTNDQQAKPEGKCKKKIGNPSPKIRNTAGFTFRLFLSSGEENSALEQCSKVRVLSFSLNVTQKQHRRRRRHLLLASS